VTPRDQALDVRLELSDPRELFSASPPDPLAGRPYGESGVDRILNQLRPRPGRRVRATIVLPEAARAPDLEARCRAALENFCSTRIAHIHNDRRSLWHEGRATLTRGLLFLAICMLGSRLVGEPVYLHPVIARFLDEGFVIAGWVALWWPLDVLLYQRWPLARERRMYESLQSMELAFEFADG
jgi:hypothetical protein